MTSLFKGLTVSAFSTRVSPEPCLENRPPMKHVDAQYLATLHEEAAQSLSGGFS